jgi:hypothetical protein
MKPPFSPIMVPATVCSKCCSNMRPTVDHQPNGQFLRVVFSCDTCECAFEPSVQYHTGQYVDYKPLPKQPQTVGEAGVSLVERVAAAAGVPAAETTTVDPNETKTA